MSQHRIWHSRGYLPHFDRPEAIQGITFRLADSVPADLLQEWRQELQLSGGEKATDPRIAQLRQRTEHYADQGYGSCWLKEPHVAELVENALLHFDGQRYKLLAWSIMPNHVHALIETMPGFALGGIIHSWKSFTAKKANQLLGRQGDFWQPDYFDRFIRDEAHLAAAKAYIEENPVKANLVTNAGDWPWSSAKLKGS